MEALIEAVNDIIVINENWIADAQQHGGIPEFKEAQQLIAKNQELREQLILFRRRMS